MRAIVFVVATFPLLFAAGCGEEEKAVSIRAENRANLAKVHVGMTRDALIELMGDKTASPNWGKNEITITNPYRAEVKEVNDHTYEVLWYYTHQDQYDWPFKRFKVLDRELTPIVMEEAKVIGWGNEFLQKKLNE